MSNSPRNGAPPAVAMQQVVSEKILAWNDSLGMVPPPMNKTINVW
jgi:hypothetical protein